MRYKNWLSNSISSHFKAKKHVSKGFQITFRWVQDVRDRPRISMQSITKCAILIS
ncbi:UNVERIFIED_CONTAM: hypothetical protein FKN15_020250 [Acipenser sinensis]